MLDRLGPWPAFAAFAIVGTVACGFALRKVLPLIGTIDAGASLIVLGARDTAGLPLGISFPALPAITLTPAPQSGPGRKRAHTRPSGIDWAPIFLSIAALGVGLALLSPPLTELVVRMIVEKRGYVECPQLTGFHSEPWC